MPRPCGNSGWTDRTARPWVIGSPREPLPAQVSEDETEGGLPEVLAGYIDKECPAGLRQISIPRVARGHRYVYVPGLSGTSPDPAVGGPVFDPLIQSASTDPSDSNPSAGTSGRTLTGLFEHSDDARFR